MNGLDGFPEPEPMNPAFEPVMIRRHCDEQGGEAGQRPIAGLEPSHFVECDGADKRSDEKDEAPAGQLCARLRAPREPPVDACEQALES